MISPFSLKAPSTRRILSFAKVLTAKGNGVTVVLPALDRYSAYKVETLEHISGVNLYYPYQFKTANSTINLMPFSLSSGLKTFYKKFDIIHILKPTPLTASAYIGRELSRIPIVQDVDDLDHLVMAAERHSIAATWFTAQCEKIIPRIANHVVVSCSGLNSYYSNITKKSKITLIPNGVFIEDFKATKEQSIIKKYNLKEKVIIYVGSLNNERQISPLLFSMQKIISQRNDTSCLIVGDGQARRQLEQLSSNLKISNHVTFTGKVPHSDVPKLMAVSSIGFACYPALDYLNYVSNIKVFEYMASGLTVVVGPTGDLPLYVDYGKAGAIVTAETGKLSNILLELLDDDRKAKRLSQHAQEYVKNFDWQILTNKLITVYSRVVN